MRVFVILPLLILAGAPAQDVRASCAPQCVAHARQESGIFTNRVGPTRGAIDWFERALAEGNIKHHPGTGFVGLPLVLGVQPGIDPRYGHVIYVAYSHEIVGGRAYQLLISHSNFDGRCNTEMAEAQYFPVSREIDFLDGHFAGRTFSVEGFITR